jgi:capsular polysaccharide biosynthesis protein
LPVDHEGRRSSARNAGKWIEGSSLKNMRPMMSKEPFESIEGPDSEVAEFRAEATGAPEAGQAVTSDNPTSVDSDSGSVVTPVRKRSRKLRSQPVSGAREPRARKRTQAVKVDAALEPEFLSGLETDPTPAEPEHAPDSAAESFANGSPSTPTGPDWPPHAVTAENEIAAPQNGHAAAEPPPADETAIDPTPSNWNGIEQVESNGSVPPEAAPAPTAAEFQDIMREEQPVERRSAAAQDNHIEERFEHRWQHHEYARQPEPQAFAAVAAVGAAMVGAEPSTEPNPQVETGIVTRTSSESLAARIRHSLKLQLVLIALVPMLLGGLIPGLIAYMNPDVFAARSEIVLNISSLDWSAAERFRATQLVVVKARSTLVPISESMNIPLRDLERDIQVGMMGSSDVIGIQYANRDPATALEVVNAVTAQYLIDLRDFEQIRNGRHRVLLPATLLDDPVSLSPLRAAVIGVIVGFVIAMAGIVLRTQLRPIK